MSRNWKEVERELTEADYAQNLALSYTIRRAYKFIIKSGKENERVIDTLPNGGVVSVDGRLCVVIASSEDEARAVAEKHADEFGFDSRWLKVADVKVLEITSPKCLCWVEL